MNNDKRKQKALDAIQAIIKAAKELVEVEQAYAKTKAPREKRGYNE
jgi:hypothetical protein